MAATFTKISATTVGSGGASAITFSNIPQTYNDLFVKFSIKSTTANQNTDGLFFKLNNSSASFTRKSVYGDGSGAGTSSQSNAYLGFASGGSATNIFGSGELYIPNYTGSNYKTSSSDTVSEANQTVAYQFLAGQLWSQTSAVTQIDLYFSGSDTIGQYSSATLYGISNS